MEQLLDQIRTWRRHLHAIPEIGFQEYKTSKYLYEELKKIKSIIKYVNRNRGACRQAERKSSNFDPLT